MPEKRRKSAHQVRRKGKKDLDEQAISYLDRVPWLKDCSEPFQTGFVFAWRSVVSPGYPVQVPLELRGSAPFQMGRKLGMKTASAYRKFIKVRQRASELSADYTDVAPHCKNEGEFVGALGASVDPNALSSFKWRHRHEDWRKDYQQGRRKQRRRKRLVTDDEAPKLVVLYSAIVRAEPEFDDDGKLCALHLHARVTSVAAFLRILFPNLAAKQLTKLSIKCSELGLRLRKPGRPPSA